MRLEREKKHQDSSVYIIAEAGVNHNGSVANALELIQEAKKSGANCVKFQTFKAERVVTATSPKAKYQLKTTDKSESQLEMLQKLELRKEDYNLILSLCKELDIEFMSTPYNDEDVLFLNDLGVNAFKIASGQLVELSFLKFVASFGKPIILSTGMGTLAEVYDAVEAIKSTGNNQLTILQCTTNYPSDISDANVNTMLAMKKSLDVTVGYSDHVPNNYACYAAVALGAVIIEKHFTLNKEMEGPDHSSSLNPTEFTELVNGIRNVEKSLGSFVKKPTPIELENKVGMRRSIVLTMDLKEGTTIEEKHITFKRPATGINPKYLDNVLGKRITESLPKDTMLSFDILR